MAHGWVSGGAASESERDISVGGVGQVPGELFAGFWLRRLGHLHGQQTIAPQMRYSGSPLPYSFSEALAPQGQAGSSTSTAKGQRRSRQVPAPVLPAAERAPRAGSPTCSARPPYGQYEDDFVSVTLTDPSRPEGSMDALGARFPHVLVLAFEPEGVLPDQRGYRARTAGRDDLSIAAEFVMHVSNATPTRPRNTCWPARSPRSARKRRRG